MIRLPYPAWEVVLVAKPVRVWPNVGVRDDSHLFQRWTLERERERDILVRSMQLGPVGKFRHKHVRGL